MKRICLFCLALVLLAGSALGESSRTEFQFVIHQNDTESAVTAEILLRGNEVLITSGLLPSYAFSIPGDYGLLTSCLDTIELFNPFSLPFFPPALMKTAEMMNLEKTKGYFSGDLFESASVQIRGIFPISELKSILDTAAEAGIAGTDTYGIIENMSAVLEMAGLNGISIQYNLYDDGRYLILNAQDKERTVFTVSMDFGNPTAVKTILGYADKGSNYYWVSELSTVSETEMHYSSAMVVDRLKHGYRSVEKNPPVLKENWIFQLSDDLKLLSFTGEILPENNKKPIEINGTLSLEGKPELTAKISFRDWKEAFFTVCAKTDESTVNTEGLEILSLEDITETGKTILEAEMSENIIQLLMKLMFALPDEYRDIFLPAA